MKTDTSIPKRKWPVKRTIAISFIILLSIAAILLYNNFNELLSDALSQSFDSNIMSDVYELKFEKLKVNPFEGSIEVSNVTLQPREKPLRNYPYINSSFVLKTEKLTLKNVAIFTLLKSHELILDRISIAKPEIRLLLGGVHHLLLPFKDSTTTTTQGGENKKKTIDAFILSEFQLIDASFHVTNSDAQREFKIQKFNIDLHDLLISQQPAKDIIAFKQVDLSVGEFSGRLLMGSIRNVSLRDYSLKVDSLEIQKTLDTLIYHFHDLHTGLNALDIQTADSIYQVSLKSVNLAYRDKSIKMNGLSFKPNVSNATLQKKYKYQHTEFSGAIGTLKLINANFDSLINFRKLFIDEVVLDEVTASLFKDKTKPMDKNRMPVYLGQTVKAIPVPLFIKQVKVTNVHLTNVERKPDSTYAKVQIYRGAVVVKNITNLHSQKGLILNADAYIEDKAHVKLNLEFNYLNPQFSFNGVVDKFNLPDLNALIMAYTPAKINDGKLDEMTFFGIAERTSASGTLKFLYHDLEVDLELQEKAKWKSSVIAFTANSVLNSSNPGSAKLPPRVVKFQIKRDMNKGFVNVIMKSMLTGLKETMVMSKENRKAYRSSKRKLKQQD
jgi:hypothetical protein